MTRKEVQERYRAKRKAKRVAEGTYGRVYVKKGPHSCKKCGIVFEGRQCNPCTTIARRLWRIKNPGKNTAIQQRRAANKIKATSGWANEFFIQEIYELAALRTKVFGFSWHVDHIVPLRSKVVCGLHVENNLRVIPGIDNMLKGNRHDSTA